MATHDYVIANGTGAAVRSDLNNALAAIVSNNSGSSEPGTTYAYQWWADTNANVLKLRNSSNDGWVTLRELDGTMLIEDGSASTPGLAFADDVNTGIFSPAADQIGFATGGAERLEIGSSEVVFNDPSNDVDFRVESNGNTHMLFVDAGNDRVGIGTASPTSLIHGEVSSGSAILTLKSTATSGEASVSITGENSSGTARTGIFKYDNSDRFRIGTAAGIPVAFETNDAERMRIDSSGRVGIGETSMDGLLVIKGDSNDTSMPSIRLKDGTDTREAWISNSSGDLVLANGGDDNTPHCKLTMFDGNIMSFAVSNTEQMRLDSSGNLGIGTSSPSGLLHISGDTCQMHFTDEDDSSSSRIYQSGATFAIDVDQANAKGGSVLAFRVDDSEHARILEDGRFLVGTTTALSDGLICFKGTFASNRGLVLESTQSSGEMIRFNTSSGGAGNISSSGTSTTYSTSSDHRLKENIVDLDGAIDRVKQLAPKRFNFICDADTTVDGFIAHEAQAVVPEAITGTHNGVEVWKEGEELPDGVSVGDNKLDEDGNAIPDYQGIDQSKLVPLLTAALQEAIAKIETLETKVAALEAG